MPGRVPDCNLQQPAWPRCSAPVNLSKSAYDRQISSPVEGTADLFSGRYNDSQPFFSLLPSEQLCVFHFCVCCFRAATLFTVTAKNREDKKLLCMSLHSPVLCRLSLSYRVSTVASISALNENDILWNILEEMLYVN